MNPTRNISDKDWISLQFKVQEVKIAEAFKIFRSNKIEPILIKGWAIARLYPSENLRPFADIDLCVDPKVYIKALKLLKLDRIKRLNIDLHCGMRHLDTVEWQELFKNSKIVEIKNEKVRVLSPEDHLRVLAVHWLNDRGQDREKLWDVYYVFENTVKNVGSFNWEKCLNVVGQNRRRWIMCTLGLAQKYLQISLEHTPFKNQHIELPAWLCQAVETEWARDFKFKPLQQCLNDKKELYRQIRLRFPPSAVQAVIEMEGSFDTRTRIQYQIGNIFVRIVPSIRRIFEALKGKLNAKRDSFDN